jgi:hypothetical protein
MNEEVEIDVALAGSEIARYNFYHIRWLLAADTAGLLALIIMTYLSIFHRSPAARDLFGSLLIWAVLLLAAGLSQPLILFLQIFVLRNPTMASQTALRIYRFAANGIHVRSGGRTAITSWNKIVKVKDIGRLVLIFTGPRLAYVIPKRCFATLDEAGAWTRFFLEKMDEHKKTRPKG